jgi:hypothetical protein
VSMKNKINEILYNNYYCVDGSFVFYLKEMSEFNEAAFWDYYNSLVELNRATMNESSLNRETMHIVCRTYNYIFTSFMWHFCPQDLYSVSKLPDDITPYIERLEFAFDGFINGKIFDEGIFELKNTITK